MRANLALTQKKFVDEISAVDAAEKEDLDVEYDGLCAQVVRLTRRKVWCIAGCLCSLCLLCPR